MVHVISNTNIQKLLNESESLSLSLISRSANVEVDNLARRICTEPHHIIYVNNIPQEWLF
jgi:hypothetical protein